MFRLIKTIANPYLLLAVNVLIILAVELTGEGAYFVRSGLIHGLAIFFVVVSALMTLIPYPLSDPIARKFIFSSLAAMLIFASSHLFEFFGFRVFDLPADAIYLNVANFYIASVFAMLVGIEMFLRIYRHRSVLRTVIYVGGLLAFVAIAIWVFLNPNRVSLAEFNPLIGTYAGVAVIVTAIGIRDLFRMRSISVLVPFVNYLAVGLVFILFSILINLLYNFVKDLLGISVIQVVNLAHFGFYAALSAMIASFANLSQSLQKLGGIYQDLREMSQNK